MPRSAEADGLTDRQRDILGAVREFVDAEIIPVAGDLDRTDTYPDQIVAGLRELGVFGLTIDPEYGGLGASLLTYAPAPGKRGPGAGGAPPPGLFPQMGGDRGGPGHTAPPRCPAPPHRL